MLQFTPIKTLAVVVRCIIANGKTGPLSIIEVNIAVQDLFHGISCAALLQPEINVEFFFYPAIQCLVDRIVGWVFLPVTWIEQYCYLGSVHCTPWRNTRSPGQYG